MLLILKGPKIQFIKLMQLLIKQLTIGKLHTIKLKKKKKMFKNMVTLLILIFNARTVMMMVVYLVNGLGRSKV